MDPVAPRPHSAPAVINKMPGTRGVLLSALVSPSSGRKRNLPDLDGFFLFDGQWSRGRVCLETGSPCVVLAGLQLAEICLPLPSKC